MLILTIMGTSGCSHVWVWKTGESLWPLSGCLLPVIQSMANDTNPSLAELVVLRSLQDKSPDPLRCWGRAQGIWGGGWEKVVINTSYSHVTSQTGGLTV